MAIAVSRRARASLWLWFGLENPDCRQSLFNPFTFGNKPRWRIMRNLLWVGNPLFASAMADCGWTVAVHNPPDPEILCWNVLKRAAGFKPDVVVIADQNAPRVLGVEEFPCLTVFYSLDSHRHPWHARFAGAFDACLVAQRDHMATFSESFLSPQHIWWLPPFAPDSPAPAADSAKSVNCLFVGCLDKRLKPRRALFLESLAAELPELEAIAGNYHELYPQARVLLNHAEYGELNARFFEAMSLGCVVSPRVGNGMEKLFVDGEHFVGYAPDDAGDAAYRVNFLLKHPDLREYIARTGAEEINLKHRAIHRAQEFTDHVCDLCLDGVDAIVGARRGNAGIILEECLADAYRVWASCDPAHKDAYLAAANGSFGLGGLAGETSGKR